jgi:hypothetical protein
LSEAAQNSPRQAPHVTERGGACRNGENTSLTQRRQGRKEKDEDIISRRGAESAGRRIDFGEGKGKIKLSLCELCGSSGAGEKKSFVSRKGAKDAKKIMQESGFRIQHSETSNEQHVTSNVFQSAIRHPQSAIERPADQYSEES